MNIRWKWIIALGVGFVVILWIFGALENRANKRRDAARRDSVTRTTSSPLQLSGRGRRRSLQRDRVHGPDRQAEPRNSA